MGGSVRRWGRGREVSRGDGAGGGSLAGSHHRDGQLRPSVTARDGGAGGGSPRGRSSARPRLTRGRCPTRLAPRPALGLLRCPGQVTGGGAGAQPCTCWRRQGRGQCGVGCTAWPGGSLWPPAPGHTPAAAARGHGRAAEGGMGWLMWEAEVRGHSGDGAGVQSDKGGGGRGRVGRTLVSPAVALVYLGVRGQKLR